MPAEGKRRGTAPREYEIVIVPLGESRSTKRFRASRLKLALIGALLFLTSVAITLAFLVYTPVAMYVPIPNPGLEQRYGRQIVDTQERLKQLAEDVLAMREYNLKLRKALGERMEKDSAGGTEEHAPAAAESSSPPQAEGVMDERQLPGDDVVAGKGDDLEVQAPAYNVVVTGGTAIHSGFPLVQPVNGFVTQEFSPGRRHYGIDFAGKQGTPVYAAADGSVIFAGWTYDDGNMVILSHGGGYLTIYKHNQQVLKTVHAVVKRGEAIALLGSSGRTSLGPHLHFEVWKDGTPRDPNEYLLTPTRVE